MNALLQNELRAAGWSPGSRRQSVRTNRAGIEFEVGPAPGSDNRLELRYRYHTERTRADGEVPLPDGAGRTEIEDAMTGIYQRVHEKPDMSRVFGGGKKRKPFSPPVLLPDPEPDPGQGALDF